MNIAIVDNKTDELENLTRLIKHKGYDFGVIAPAELVTLSSNDADLVVLSGGYWYDDPSVFGHAYQAEISFIQKTSTPLLGICLGMQLITLAYGGEVSRLKTEYHGLRKLSFSDKLNFEKELPADQLFFENHTVGVIGVPVSFDELARSEECSEIIAHRSKPIIGVQFHPERLSKNQHSFEIWDFLLHKTFKY